MTQASHLNPNQNSAIPILTVAQIRALEASADARGITYSEMMKRAGAALAKRILRHILDHENDEILFLIGPGNNGGDGLVAACALLEGGIQRVYAHLLQARDDPLMLAAIDAGLTHQIAETDEGFAWLKQQTQSAKVIVDALFGIGLRPPLRDDPASLLRALRSVLQPVSDNPSEIISAIPSSGTSRPHIIAVDCPSGLAADSGEMDPAALPANETLTFIAPKPGLFAAEDSIGSLTIAPLGIPLEWVQEPTSPWQLAHPVYARSLLPKRSNFSHKGSNGRVLIAAGSARYIGAVALAASSAYRSGAGSVQIASPACVRKQLASRLLEATWLSLTAKNSLGPAEAGMIAEAAQDSDALLVGPGLGLAKETADFLITLVGAELPPLILDADALTLLSRMKDWPNRLPPHTILTPHPREFSRLCGRSVIEIQGNRWEIANECAERWGVTLLLKGAYTVIAAPAEPLTVLPFCLDALATAGSGDVLSGIIAAMLAGGNQATPAAIVSAYLHALAGKIAQNSLGSARAVSAGDLPAALGMAFAQLESTSA